MTEQTPAGSGSVEIVGKSTGKKRADQVAAVVLFLFSGYILLNAFRMPLFEKYRPGPGFFPLILGICLAALSISLFVEASSPKAKDGPSPFPGKKGMISVALVVIGLAVYTLIITKLGFVLTTLLFVLFLMGVVQRDNLKTTVLTAIGVSLILYLIFEVALGLRLPRGPLGF